MKKSIIGRLGGTTPSHAHGNHGGKQPPTVPPVRGGLQQPATSEDAVPTDFKDDWMDEADTENGDQPKLPTTGEAATHPPAAKPRVDPDAPSTHGSAPATDTAGAGVAEPALAPDGRPLARVPGSKRKFL